MYRLIIRHNIPKQSSNLGKKNLLSFIIISIRGVILYQHSQIWNYQTIVFVGFLISIYKKYFYYNYFCLLMSLTAMLWILDL